MGDGFTKRLISLHTEVEYNKIASDVHHFLIENEKVIHSFQSGSGVLAFTNGRIFHVQEAVGKGKKEYASILYKNISKFSVESAGIMDMDAELHVWHSGSEGPMKWGFARKTDIIELSKTIFKHSLK